MKKTIYFWCSALFLSYSLLTDVHVALAEDTDPHCIFNESLPLCLLGEMINCTFLQGYITKTTIDAQIDYIQITGPSKEKTAGSFLRFVFCKNLIHFESELDSISVGSGITKERNTITTITPTMKDPVTYVAVSDQVAWMMFQQKENKQISKFDIYFEFVQYTEVYNDSMVGKTSGQICSTNPYPPNHRYEWLVEVNEHYHLELTVHSIQMDPLKGDYLTIMPGNSSKNTNGVLVTWKTDERLKIQMPYYNKATVVFRTQLQDKPTTNYGFCLTFKQGGTMWTTVPLSTPLPAIPTVPADIKADFSFAFAADDIHNYTEKYFQEGLANITAKYCEEYSCNISNPVLNHNVILDDAYFMTQKKGVSGYCINVTFHIAMYNDNGSYAFPRDRLQHIWDAYGHELCPNKPCIFAKKQQYTWWLVGAVITTVVFAICLLFIWREVRLTSWKKEQEKYLQKGDFFEGRESATSAWSGKSVDKNVFKNFEDGDMDGSDTGTYIEFDPEFGTPYHSGIDDFSGSPPQSPSAINTTMFMPVKIFGGPQINPAFTEEEDKMENTTDNNSGPETLDAPDTLQLTRKIKRRSSSHIYDIPKEIQLQSFPKHGNETVM